MPGNSRSTTTRRQRSARVPVNEDGFQPVGRGGKAKTVVLAKPSRGGERKLFPDQPREVETVMSLFAECESGVSSTALDLDAAPRARIKKLKLISDSVMENSAPAEALVRSEAGEAESAPSTTPTYASVVRAPTRSRTRQKSSEILPDEQVEQQEQRARRSIVDLPKVTNRHKVSQALPEEQAQTPESGVDVDNYGVVNNNNSLKVKKTKQHKKKY